MMQFHSDETEERRQAAIGVTAQINPIPTKESKMTSNNNTARYSKLQNERALQILKASLEPWAKHLEGLGLIREVCEHAGLIQVESVEACRQSKGSFHVNPTRKRTAEVWVNVAGETHSYRTSTFHGKSGTAIERILTRPVAVLAENKAKGLDRDAGDFHIVLGATKAEITEHVEVFYDLFRQHGFELFNLSDFINHTHH